MSSDVETVDVPANCRFCNNHPCVLEELEPVFQSMMENYAGYKPNKAVRYSMYTETIRVIHGPCLGRKVRKRVPQCVEERIRSLLPDKTYTGFKES